MKSFMLAVALVLMPSVAFAQNAEVASLRIYVFSDDTQREDDYPEGGDQFPDSMGSGVLISDGQVLTCHHVVKSRRKGDESVQVRFTDGWRAWARVIAEDETWDVALLQIQPHAKITPVPSGSEPVLHQQLTIQGYGGDYEYKAQTGHLNGRVGPKKGVTIYDMIRVSGAVARPGDSGGPITNSRGEWVGILCASTWNDLDYGRYTIGTPIDRIKSIFGSKMKLYTQRRNDYILRGDYRGR